MNATAEAKTHGETRTWLRALQTHWPDLLGITLAAVYAWPTTAYRFGRDQALFHYIGREWLSGRVPYRDAFDLKPPGIYFVHALSCALLGRNQTGIRVLDVFAVIATGVVAALAVRRRGTRMAGELGIGALLAVSWYFTVFDYWDTAQAEIWESLALLGAYALFVRVPVLRMRPLLLGGALVGMAGLFKFTAAIPALGVVTVAALRAGAHGEGTSERVRDVVKALAWLGLGVVLPWLAFGLYFAATGALPAVRDMFELVMHYAQNDLNADSAQKVEAFWFRQSGWWLALFTSAWLCALGLAAIRRDRHVLFGAISAGALCVLCVLSVYAQKKFFTYHWGVLTGAFILLGAYGVRELVTLPEPLRLLPALAVLTGGFLSSPTWPANSSMDYRRFATQVYPRRKLLPELLNRSFTGIANYNYDAQVQIAREIKARQRPGDLLHVRGFELAMYALTGLHTPVRFPSEVLFDDLRWATHPQEWSEEQERTLWAAHPRFIVTFRDRPWDLEKIQGQGYHELTRAGLFVLFERG